MGKKSKILYYSVLFVNLACFILDLIPGINFPFFRISFAVSLMLIGLLLITRAVTLKLDSSMFIGSLLFMFGVLNMLLYFGQTYNWLTVTRIVPYYLFAISLSSLITGLYFKEKLQLKMFVLFLGFGLITLLFVEKVLILGWYIGIMVAWFVVYFIINTILFKKRSK
ncbi:MAG: hypothetical protein IJW36_01750 [Clostridia bacterium]|nr:hypothetical protein [Clostridia bacterium]